MSPKSVWEPNVMNTQSRLYISSVSGSGGCHNDDDTNRALLAAQAVIETEIEEAAFKAYVARGNCEDHDAALANAWEKAQRATNIALTLGWDNPGYTRCELAINIKNPAVRIAQANLKCAVWMALIGLGAASCILFGAGVASLLSHGVM